MSLLSVNLARDPFRNRQPVLRLAVLLWGLALGLTLWNGWEFWIGGRERAAKEEELARLNQEIVTIRERIETLAKDLQQADLRATNRRTEFLNHRIAERALSLNELLGELARTLPRSVRLVRLVPKIELTKSRSEARPTGVVERVRVTFEGEAEDREALLSWLDGLFADPVLEQPVLKRENVERSGLIRFSGEVLYRPTGRRTGQVEALASPAARPAAVEPAPRRDASHRDSAETSPEGRPQVATRVEKGGGARQASPAPRGDRQESGGSRSEARAGREMAPGAGAEARPEAAPAAAPPAPEQAPRSIFGLPMAARPAASPGGR